MSVELYNNSILWDINKLKNNKKFNITLDPFQHLECLAHITPLSQREYSIFPQNILVEKRCSLIGQEEVQDNIMRDVCYYPLLQGRNPI